MFFPHHRLRAHSVQGTPHSLVLILSTPPNRDITNIFCTMELRLRKTKWLWAARGSKRESWDSPSLAPKPNLWTGFPTQVSKKLLCPRGAGGPGRVGSVPGYKSCIGKGRGNAWDAGLEVECEPGNADRVLLGLSSSYWLVCFHVRRGWGLEKTQEHLERALQVMLAWLCSGHHCRLHPTVAGPASPLESHGQKRAGQGGTLTNQVKGLIQGGSWVKYQRAHVRQSLWAFVILATGRSSVTVQDQHKASSMDRPCKEPGYEKGDTTEGLSCRAGPSLATPNSLSPWWEKRKQLCSDVAQTASVHSVPFTSPQPLRQQHAPLEGFPGKSDPRVLDLLNFTKHRYFITFYI